MDATITGAAVDAGGALWLTTRKGAARYHDGRFIPVETSSAALEGNLFGILADREGNIWIGTNDGVSKLVSGPFRGYSEAESLPSKYVSSLTGDATGGVWIGMPFGGIAIYENENLRLLGDNSEIAPRTVTALAALSDGRMLAGTAEGLILLQGERIEKVYQTTDGLPHRRVTCLLADATGAWIGTQQGLARFQDGRISGLISAVAPKALRERIEALALDRQGRLWVGVHSGGVAIYDGRVVERLTAANGLTHQLVSHFALQADGSMWVATSGEGVFRVKDGNIRHYTTADGLVDDTVWQLLFDRRGDLWLYTNRGLDRFDGRSFRHYGRGDGLIALEGTNGAAWEDPSGDLWFGTANGVMRFMPAEERHNAVPPKVVIEGNTTRFGSLRPGGHVSPGADLLMFRFAALSYRNSSAIRYQYRIVGLQDRWTAPTVETSVSVASPPPGTYVLEVKGSNEDGLYASVPGRFEFVVDPFFWQAEWFRIALAASLAASLLALHRWRTGKLEMDRRRLEQAVAERTAKLNAMNQRLEKLATTDELTGLANRRHFQQTLEAQLRTLSRARPVQSLSLLLLDVDRFKRINDVYGHPEGDALLAALAKRLQVNARTSDLVARYGGEEFAVILPATDRTGAAAMARKLHAAVRDTAFEAGGRPLRVTISLGVTTTKVTGAEVSAIAERLVREADEALYRAKGEGRDRVVTAGPSLVATAAANAS